MMTRETELQSKWPEIMKEKHCRDIATRARASVVATTDFTIIFCLIISNSVDAYKKKKKRKGSGKAKKFILRFLRHFRLSMRNRHIDINILAARFTLKLSHSHLDVYTLINETLGIK